MSKLIILSILIVIVNKIKSQENSTTENTTPFCKSPKKDSNFDPVWLDENTPPSGWHLIMGSSSARLHFSQLLKGRDLKESEDFSGMCATSVYSNTKTHIGGHFRGYENLSATRNCTNSTGDVLCEFVSVTNPDWKDSAKVYVAYFGEKSYLNFQIAVYCFTNGDTGWILSAIRKSLTVEENSSALKQLKLLGFDTKEGVPMYTDLCGHIETKSVWFPSGLWHKERQSYFAPPSQQHQQHDHGHGWKGWSRW